MITLKEFLDTKNVDFSKNGFPKTPDIDLIIQFLKENNFVELERDKINFPTATGQLLSGTGRHDKNVYVCAILGATTNPLGTAIYFCKQGEISSKNPIFYVRINKKDENCSFMRKSPDNHEFEDIKEFKREVDNCYGF